MPDPGNLRSNKKKDVRLRVKCLHALTRQLDRDFRARETNQQKIRRAEHDRELLEKRCKILESKLLDMDRRKYQAELKAHEQEQAARTVKRDSEIAKRSSIAGNQTGA